MPLPQQPLSAPPDVAGTVLEFGADRPARSRWSGSGALRGLTGDRRVVPLAAVLAAVAVFGSLVSEWQITTVDGRFYSDEGIGKRELAAGATDLGALGTGYLVGVFVVVAAVVLTLFGPPAGRRYARLIGLSTAGTVLGLLLALTVGLSGDSRAIPVMFRATEATDQLEIEYGRGLWCALAGTVLALIALYVAARHVPGGDDPGWSWRRPASEPQVEDEPLELTVMPAKPFTPSADDHARPAGSTG